MLPYLLYLSPRYLLLSSYIMHVPSLISITVSLLAPACLCSCHSFQCIFMTQIYSYTYAYLCTPPGIRITTRWEFWLFWILISRSRCLELVDSLSYWLEWRSENMDHRQTVWSPIIPALCASLEFSFCNSWAPFVLFILVYFFVFSHLRLLVM